MRAFSKFDTDYAALYPGVEISDEVMAVLKKSDRKMKYMAKDLKVERPVKGENGEIIAVLPGREDSYERLLDMDVQFVDEFSADPVQILMKKEEIDTLRRCLAMLSGNERMLIKGLYYDDMTERGYAAVCGLSQPTVKRLRRRVLEKMKKYFLNLSA